MTSKLKKKDKEKFYEDVVKEVKLDFEKRQKERKLYERQWELNMNFVEGNQYCDISKRGDVVNSNDGFYWQNKEVFNHIAPIVELRLSKFSRITPIISIRPKTDDDLDVKNANTTEKLLSDAFDKADIRSAVKKATVWSETCGSSFYKIVWNNMGGNVLGSVNGKPVYEGDVEVIPISPFEIFPDNLYSHELCDCQSIIHARAVSTSEIKEKYGVNLVGDDIDVFNLTKNKSYIDGEDSSIMSSSVVVIEKYEKPNSEFPNGRLITVAGDKLLYYGELPYLNGKNCSRAFPFVKQDCVESAGGFFGNSIVERLIPVQRAFNAVKNRKHEFLNRLSMGIMTVEDGSCDVEDLESEGLPPGKVLVYRQGSKAPEMLNETTMPSEFDKEEEKLLNEFVSVSGVSDVSSSSANARLTSGTALELLIEQDNERLVVSAEAIRKSYIEIAKQIIRLYAQFLSGVKAVRHKDNEGKTKIIYVDKNNIVSDDAYIENENELLYSTTQKKEVIFNLYNSGLLSDDKGVMRRVTKEKVLNLMGYKDLDYQKGISSLQEEKAQQENQTLKQKQIEIEIIDDDEIHIDEHVRFILSEYNSLSSEQKERYFNHVKEHKQNLENNKNKGVNYGTN